MEGFLSFIHSWEWMLILALIVIDVTLFVSTIREKRERETLIAEMTKTRMEFGREEYLKMITDTLKTAQKYNYWTSHTLTSLMPEKDKQELFRHYKPTLDNKLLTAKDMSKIKFMLEQKRKGVQVRVNDLLLISTFRFQIVDDEKAVLGFATEGVNSSRKGILISDSFFVASLKEHFEGLWAKSQPFEDYIKEVLHNIKEEKIGIELGKFVSDWQLTLQEQKEIGITKEDIQS